MNNEKEDLCMGLLLNCEKWSIPGLFGCFPALRILIFNNFGVFFRKKGSFGIALNYYLKALKLSHSSNIKDFRSLSHMNMGSLLLEFNEFLIKFYFAPFKNFFLYKKPE